MELVPTRRGIEAGVLSKQICHLACPGLPWDRSVTKGRDLRFGLFLHRPSKYQEEFRPYRNRAEGLDPDAKVKKSMALSSFILRPLLFAALAAQICSAQQPKVSTQDVFPGISATPAKDDFPGVTAMPIENTPLAGTPSVLSLDRLDPEQMSAADHDVVSNLSAELSRQAAFSNFDISNPAWHYQQVVCPALPDYVFLSFLRGADESGSSRFAAMLPRDSAKVRIISTYAHGLLPFDASWNRPSSFEVFNEMLGQERGKVPVSHAPNWLVIGLCYAELSGYPVQVLNPTPNPDPTLDALRLDANWPQMTVQPDQSADVNFSDVSRSRYTTNWNLHFDRHGQITGVNRSAVRQPSAIALKP